MTERKSPTPLSDLGERLCQARKRREKGADHDSAAAAPMQGIGFAFRIGVELVSALIVGVGIGLLVDLWLDSGPWGLIIFFFLGAAAGILNVYRTVSKIGLAPGYPKDDRRDPGHIMSGGEDETAAEDDENAPGEEGEEKS